MMTKGNQRLLPVSGKVLNMRKIQNKRTYWYRIAGLWLVVLFLFSGCRSNGSAVILEASGETEAETETESAEQKETVSETIEHTGMIVHIAGQVENPGVYELPSGSRVWDGVQAAGGFTEDADPDRINLAALLEDGCKVTIPKAGEEDTANWYEEASENPGIQDGGTSRKGEEAEGLININQASASELATLPGIGEVRAEAIIAYRTAHGSFRSIEEIMNVSGIKEGLFEKIRGYITVGG
jgi:competence protein ComEA